jgi:hypothetical protein
MEMVGRSETAGAGSDFYGKPRAALVATWLRAPVTWLGQLCKGESRRRALMRKVETKAKQVIDQHADALIGTRALLLRYDGTSASSPAWEETVARFISSEIARVLDQQELAALEGDFRAMQAYVARRIGEIAASQWIYM